MNLYLIHINIKYINQQYPGFKKYLMLNYDDNNKKNSQYTTNHENNN